MTVTRPILALAVAVHLATPAPACTFCGPSARTQPTLRVRYAEAKLVAFGRLANPRFDPRTEAGTTEFHVGTVLKDDPARGGRTVLVVPRYLPVIGDTPTDYLLVCGVAGGQLDPSYGLPSTPAVAAYLKAVAALDASDPAGLLGFSFGHLDSPDPAVAEDAFREFARAADGDILKAGRQYDPARLRRLIADPNTPADRLGVFAFLLGACGTAADADFLAAMLKPNPPGERASAAFGGLLAGYVLLAPKAGWAFAAEVLADPDRGYADRLSALGTVRYFQAARAADCKAEVLRCCAALLPHGDLADQAVEDLRRWGYWDLTAEVLAQFGKPTHSAPIVRRAIVRYALTCPADEAKAFAARLRQTDPKLVKDVEEMLARFEPVKVEKK
jgi:hypothetical protein